MEIPHWFRRITEDDENLWPNLGNPPDSDDDDDDSDEDSDENSGDSGNASDPYPYATDDDYDEGGNGNSNDPPPQNAALPDSTTDEPDGDMCGKKRELAGGSESESEMSVRKVMRVSIEDVPNRAAESIEEDQDVGMSIQDETGEGSAMVTHNDNYTEEVPGPSRQVAISQVPVDRGNLCMCEEFFENQELPPHDHNQNDLGHWER